MLRSNLSTRPFYNDRAVRALVGALAALAIGLTVFNVYEILRLQRESRDSRDTISRNEAQGRELRDQAAVIRRGIDRVKLDAEYVRKWSISWDLVILARTLPAVFKVDQAA